MAQGRLTRRKVVTASFDEDEVTNAPVIVANEDDESAEEASMKPIKGKLKSIKTSRQPQQSHPSPTQDKSVKPSPKKSKITKVKSKTAAKDEPKPNGKPIYSFFNGATQKQLSQSSAPSSQPRSLTPRPDLETIDSDEDHTSEVKVSKGSSTALALRKRKLHPSQSFEDDANLAPLPTQKFRKTSEDGRMPSFSISNDDKRSWIEQFAPTNLDELAVHKRKVADVRGWLEMAFSGRRRKVLVLKGAAGSAKTTTIKLLASEMGIEISEWRNPAGTDYATEGSVGAAEQFNDFIAAAGRSSGLVFGAEGDDGRDYATINEADDDRTSGGGKQLLLVEEFPNTFSRTSPVLESFRAALSQYLSTSQAPDKAPTPIVLVVSETLLSTSTAAADSFTVHRLLGPELLNHPYVDTIEFNAIAPTILTKALETIVVKEARKSGRRKTPGPAVLKRLAETGDIRSAIASLEFLCLRGDEEGTWSAKVAFTKPKKVPLQAALTKAEEEALQLICNRESTLGIFHSVGKIVYNKRVDAAPGTEVAQPPPWLPQYRRVKVPETDIESLLDELGTDTSTFIASLHENFALSCNTGSTEETLDSLTGCIDTLSDADLLSIDRFSSGTRSLSGSATDTLRQDEMAFQVAVRGVLFSLPSPVKRGVPASGKKADAHRMFYPASLKLWRRKEEIEGLLDLLTSDAQAGVSALPVRGNNDGVDGVAGWHRQSLAPDATSVHTSPPTLSAPSKSSTLLDRLPYLSHILPDSPQNSALLSRVRKVVNIQSAPSLPTSANEDEDAAGEQDPPLGAEQWATDRPDEDAPKQARGVKKKAKKPGGVGKGELGGELGMKLEGRIEGLVIEGDDIED
ncbi:RFC checkpoint protein Rad17 [Oleoguttula sp. CCFEE 5521]